MVRGIAALLLFCSGPPLLYADEGAREHCERIASSPSMYGVTLGGTIDHAMLDRWGGMDYGTGEVRINRSLEIRNVGTDVVVNPRVLIDGRGPWFDIDEIIERSTAGLGTESDRVLALFNYHVDRIGHATSRSPWNADPVAVYNWFGCTICTEDAAVLSALYRRAGLRTRPVSPVGHAALEVFFDGSWHLLDGDRTAYYLKEDNRTLASADEVERDRELVKRTHHHGPLSPYDELTNRFYASAYYPRLLPGADAGDRLGVDDSATMTLALRPGESLIYGFTFNGRYCGACDLSAYPEAGSSLATGWLVYRPDLKDPGTRRFIEGEGVRWAPAGDVSPPVGPAEMGSPGRLEVDMEAPYPVVGGSIELDYFLEPGDEFSISLSSPGRGWSTIWTAPEGEGNRREASIDLGEHWQPWPVRRDFRIRVRMKARDEVSSVGLYKIRLKSELQMARISLPGLAFGLNQVTYRDDSEKRTIEVVHSWRESSVPHPPIPPTSPVLPAQGGEVDLGESCFQWMDARDPDGDRISAYQFQLSRRPDLRWPLSPGFDQLIVQGESGAAPARFRPPRPGMLDHGETYYWRIRARDETGLWGNWSETWTCRGRGPGPPRPGHVLYARDAGPYGFRLHWAPGRGASPEHYEVHGSTEKGFTASLSPRPRLVASMNDGQRRVETRPPTLIATVRDRSWTPMQMEQVFPFYRIAAVDDRGTKSGASWLISIRKPFLAAFLPERIPVGETIRIPVRTIASEGELRCTHRIIRDPGTPLGFRDEYRAAMGEGERFTLEILDGPEWVSLDREIMELVLSPPEGAYGREEISVGLREEILWGPLPGRREKVLALYEWARRASWWLRGRGGGGWTVFSWEVFVEGPKGAE